VNRRGLDAVRVERHPFEHRQSEAPVSEETAGVVEAPARLSDQDKGLLLTLARETLTRYLRGEPLPEPAVTSPALLAPRAVFVTLRRRRSGELRGCRGERVATRPLVRSVMDMVIASAVDDPRFEPVRLAEVPELHIEISALTPARPIRPEEVEVGRHGLIASAGRFVGLLLPQVATQYRLSREEFLQAVCEKAGLPPDAWRHPGLHLEAFEAEVWGEPD
jgi:AmmeMemoRadiSam system protein A